MEMNVKGHAYPRGVVVVMVLVGLVILIAAIHRAATASFIHDEAFTYIDFVDLDYGDILLHKHAYTNNHLLNTFAMKVCKQLFGSSELSLRLPNLLALVLFLFYAGRLLIKLPIWFAIGGFVLLGTNSYMLELFTLARGYGLSFGFMLMALFHLIRAAQRMRLRDVALFHVASVLATLSNFTLINVHLAGLITLYVLVLARVYLGDVQRKRLLPFTIANVVMLAISAAALWLPIQHTLEANALDFGGKGSFFNSTVSTWVMSFFPRMHFAEPIMIALYALVVLVVLGGLVVSIRRFKRSDTEFFSQRTDLPVITLVLVLTCLMLEVQHYWLGVDRLIQRFALFLVPLLILLIVQLLAVLYARGWRKATSAAITVAALWAGFSCSRTFGPYTSMEWQYDACTKEVVAAIALDMQGRDPHDPPVQVGINWLFGPAMNFYLQQMELDGIQPFDHESTTSANDTYRAVFGKEEASMRADGYVPLDTFPETGVILFKKAGAWQLTKPDQEAP